MFIMVPCVSLVCVLSSVVSGGDPDRVLTIQSGRAALMYMSSVLVHSLLLPLQVSIRNGVSHSQVRGACLRTRELPWYF